MTLSDEQIQDLLRVGNPADEECRLIRMGWDAAMRKRTAMSVPEGWKLVPTEPTKEMLEAGQTEWLDSAGADPSFDVYRAMLAAAPEVKK